jgi:hypothetical protein
MENLSANTPMFMSAQIVISMLIGSIFIILLTAPSWKHSLKLTTAPVVSDPRSNPRLKIRFV